MQTGVSEATRWRLDGMKDEQGRIAEDGRMKALQQLERNLQFSQQKPSTARAATWTPRGPIDRSGRMRALVIHPNDPSILWAAAGSGGIWKSEDAGVTWKPLTDKLGYPAGCLVMDPKNPDVLYFGTGERFHSGGPGAGIFVTRNGGSSWKRLAGTKHWRYVPSIAISPGDPNLLLVAVADPEGPEGGGVYRSINGGRSWTSVVQGSSLTPSSIQFQPKSKTRVLLSMRRGLFPTGETQVNVSDDAGLTWRKASGIGTTQFTRYELAFARSNPDVVYALSNEGLYRSTDGGESFVQRSQRIDIGVVSWAGMLWVSPDDPDLLLAGGVSLARSTDGGSKWNRVEYYDTQDRDVGHLDHQAAIAHPAYGKGNHRVYMLNDGGIDLFEDVRAKPLGPKRVLSLDHGLQTTEYYAVTGRAKDGILLGGAQDRGIIRANLNANRTDLAMGGDGACAILDPSDDRYQYGCGQFLWITRLEPNGPIGLTNDLIDSVPPNNDIRANFIAPVQLDPNDSKRMFAGGVSMWRSENVRKATHDPGKRATWTEIKRPLPRGPFSEGGLISSFAITLRDSNRIWVGHNDGRIFKTTNGLASSPVWEAIDDNGLINPLPNRRPLRIWIDRTNRNRIFIVFGGFTPDNLWVTTDGGHSWKSSSGSGATTLPSAPIWSFAQHPVDAKILVAGTEVGVYISKDDGKSWAAIPAPFTAAAQDIAFLQDSTTLLVGTFGRGLWTLDF